MKNLNNKKRKRSFDRGALFLKADIIEDNRSVHRTVLPLESGLKDLNAFSKNKLGIDVGGMMFKDDLDNFGRFLSKKRK